jgi:hypothetical protein
MDLAFIKQYNKDYTISLQEEINCIIYLLKDNAILPQNTEVETTAQNTEVETTAQNTEVETTTTTAQNTEVETTTTPAPTAPETEEQFYNILNEKINTYNSSNDNINKQELEEQINEKFNDPKMNIFVKVVLAIEIKNNNINNNINISKIIKEKTLADLEDEWINKIIEIEYVVNQLSRKDLNKSEINDILQKKYNSKFIEKDFIEINPFSQEEDLEMKKQEKLQEISKENEQYLQAVNSWFGGKTKRKQTKRKIYKTQHNKKTKKNTKTKKYRKRHNNKTKSK